jgi:hypothetical protein
VFRRRMRRKSDWSPKNYSVNRLEKRKEQKNWPVLPKNANPSQRCHLIKKTT